MTDDALPADGDGDAGPIDPLSHERERHVLRARERQLWRAAPERTRALWAVPACGALTLVAAVITGLYVADNNFGMDVWDIIGYAAAAWFFAYLPVAAGIWWYFRSLQFVAYRDRRILEDAKDELQSDEAAAAESDSSGGLDLAVLWSLNQRRLDYYHQIATTQAARSFRNAQGAMASAFAVLVIAVALSAFADSAPAAIATVSVGAIAGALGGYVSSTFLRSQESAALHLRSYFDQPVEFSRYLAAERLVVNLDSAQRGAATSQLAIAIVGSQPPAPPLTP